MREFYRQLEPLKLHAIVRIGQGQGLGEADYYTHAQADKQFRPETNPLIEFVSVIMS